jgi:hypothetical protein
LLAVLDARLSRSGLANAAFLVVAAVDAGKEVPFAFLRKLREDFLSKHATEGLTALTNSLDAAYR